MDRYKHTDPNGHTLVVGIVSTVDEHEVRLWTYSDDDLGPIVRLSRDDVLDLISVLASRSPEHYHGVLATIEAAAQS